MLWKKMSRDLWENKGAFIACTAIIVLGLTIFTAMSAVVGSLERSQIAFYANQNFAHGFAEVGALPKSQIERISDIEGIDALQGRIVRDLLIHRPGAKENSFLRLVSVDLKEPNLINGVHLEKGEPLKSGEMEVWLDSKFFHANSLELRDQIDVVAGGDLRRLTVTGVGMSPEFVYTLRDTGEMLPSPETFGIAFIPLDVMEKLTDEGSAINDLVFTLKPGADFEQVETKLEQLLRPYGLKAIFPRGDQPSHLYLQQEIDSVKAMAKVMPVLFLTTAAMILYISLKRLIERQRGQIGILKALGYTSQEIIFHYLSHSLTIGISGGLLGVAAGTALSYPMAAIFEEFFIIPGLAPEMSTSRIIFGIVLSTVFSLSAGYFGCKEVLKLEPTEAMRPPAPLRGKKVFFEDMTFLWRRLNVQRKMALRNISRNMGRSGLIFFGILMCFAISSFTWSMNDIIEKLIFDQYEEIEIYDVRVNLAKPVDEIGGIRELMAVEGVTEVQAIAEVPVTLTNRWHKKDTVLLGIPPGGNMYRILDDDYKGVEPPTRGILLSERLAKLVDAREGTVLTIKSPMKAGKGEGNLKVVGIIPQYIGINAYMEIGALQDFLGQRGLATSFMVNMDETKIDCLREKYTLSSTISSIDGRRQRLDRIKELMGTYASMTYIYSFIGGIMGFAIIYSSSAIAISERSRELASMMVLGMTPREVLSVITFEQWFIALPAMVAGIPLSMLMMAGMAQTLGNDLYSLPRALTPSALTLAFMATGVFIWVAQRSAVKKIGDLRLSEVLKSPE